MKKEQLPKDLIEHIAKQFDLIKDKFNLTFEKDFETFSLGYTLGIYGTLKAIDVKSVANERINNVYVLLRQDDWKYDDPTEQTIVAKTTDKAIELASKYPGVWDIEKKVDLNKEQVLTVNRNDG